MCITDNYCLLVGVFQFSIKDSAHLYASYKVINHDESREKTKRFCEEKLQIIASLSLCAYCLLSLCEYESQHPYNMHEACRSQRTPRMVSSSSATSAKINNQQPVSLYNIFDVKQQHSEGQWVHSCRRMRWSPPGKPTSTKILVTHPSDCQQRKTHCAHGK